MYTPTQRLLRSRTEKVLGGVAGGLAHYLAIDPVFIRLAFVALCFTGVGVLLYPVMWIIMPLEAPASADSHVIMANNSASRAQHVAPMTGEPIDPDQEIPINNLSESTNPSNQPQERRNKVLGVVLLGIGAFALMTILPGVGHVISRFLFPALLIIVGIILIQRNRTE